MLDWQIVWLKEARKYVTDKADYEGNGYDVFCECYGDKEWIEFMKGFATLKQVKSYIDDIADIYADRQADATNSAF